MNSKVDQKLLKELNKKLENDGIEKVVVGAVIFLDNKVLLLERLPDEFKGGLVELPSGTVEFKEAIVDSLKREVKEETDLDILELNRYIDFFDYLSSSGKKVRQFNFVVTVGPGKVQISQLEHSRFLLFDPLGDDFQSLNISAETKEVIQKSL